MAADEEVDIDFDVNDKVTPKLSRMERAVGRLDRSVGNMSNRFVGTVGAVAGVAGILGLGSAIRGAQQYISHLDKISNLSGMSAQKAGGISNALQGAGVQAGAVENIFTKLSKRGAQLGEGQKGLIKQAKGYGVELEKGPARALLDMSKQLEKGRLTTGGLQRLLSLSGDDAADLSAALKQGPEALQRGIDDATKKNAAFTEEGMEGMQRFHNSIARIKIAFGRGFGEVLIKLAPHLEKLADKMEKSVDKWAASAGKFGDFLVKHMDTIIAKAKIFATIMLVNAALQKTTGVGIVGTAGRVSRGARAAAGGVGAVAQAVSMGAGKGALITMAQSALGVVSKIVSSFLKLGPVVAIVIAVVKALGENFNGITTRLRETFGGVFNTLVRIGGKIMSFFGDDGPLGKLMGGIGYAFLETVDKIGQMMGFILSMVEKIIDLIPDVFKSVGDVAGRWKEAEAYKEKISSSLRKRGVAEAEFVGRMAGATAEAERFMKTGKWITELAPAAAMATPKGALEKLEHKKDGDKNFDFRGSRFDIKQAFAEGFDPDRIAVAFANDIATLGERKLQSGFAPLFGI
jgi:hypothetical protein